MGEKGKKKELLTVIKLQIEAGKANPAPPVGPALGQHGLNIMEFCKAYNDATKDKMGQVIPVEISVFGDRTFEFKLKTPPAAKLILESLKIAKGSGEPNKIKVGKITKAQLLEIAKKKDGGLSSFDEEAAVKIIAGTAKNMGIIIEGFGE